MCALWNSLIIRDRRRLQFPVQQIRFDIKEYKKRKKKKSQFQSSFLSPTSQGKKNKRKKKEKKRNKAFGPSLFFFSAPPPSVPPSPPSPPSSPSNRQTRVNLDRELSDWCPRRPPDLKIFNTLWLHSFLSFYRTISSFFFFFGKYLFYICT